MEIIKEIKKRYQYGLLAVFSKARAVRLARLHWLRRNAIMNYYHYDKKEGQTFKQWRDEKEISDYDFHAKK